LGKAILQVSKAGFRALSKYFWGKDGSAPRNNGPHAYAKDYVVRPYIMMMMMMMIIIIIMVKFELDRFRLDRRWCTVKSSKVTDTMAKHCILTQYSLRVNGKYQRQSIIADIAVY